MAGVMIGTIMCILGLYSLIKGKLPFIKKYDGVKKDKFTNSRIDGDGCIISRDYGSLSAYYTN